MDNKIRQITDRIHGAIYVSALEYQMMATPFFLSATRCLSEFYGIYDIPFQSY